MKDLSKKQLLQQDEVDTEVGAAIERVRNTVIDLVQQLIGQDLTLTETNQVLKAISAIGEPAAYYQQSVAPVRAEIIKIAKRKDKKFDEYQFYPWLKAHKSARGS